MFWPFGSPFNISEVLLGQIHKLLMIDSTCAHNDHIFTEIVGCVEIDNHFTIYLSNVIDVTEDWLSHHMLTVNVKIHIFHESLF